MTTTDTRHLLHTVDRGEPDLPAPRDSHIRTPHPEVVGDPARPSACETSAFDLADESSGAHLRSVLGQWAVLVVITSADLVLIKATFDRILRQAPSLSWTLGVALTLASVALAFSSGANVKKVRSGWASRDHAVIAAVQVVAFAALGAGILYLRWRAADFAPPQVAFEGANSPASTLPDTEKVLAMILATIYLATGVLAFTDGFKLTNPVAKAMRAARRSVETLMPKLADMEGRVAHLRENSAIHEHDLATIDEARGIALASRRALARELKELSRVQIALALGNPPATGLVRPDDDERSGSPEPRTTSRPGSDSGPTDSPESSQ
jgi:hypothetical protein